MENPQIARPNEPTDRPAAIPRYQLPDEWTGKGACPVCRTPGLLSVQHQDRVPDRMLCGYCGTAFEVETAGTRIRLVVAPPALGARAAELLGSWKTPAELLRRMDEPAPTTPAAAPSPAASVPTRGPTAPLAAKAAAPAPASAPAEPEPGSEDWFASLAAVIGGSGPVTPPPDAVLADELERALLHRPENGASGAAAAPAAPTTAPLGAKGENTPEPSNTITVAEPLPAAPPEPKTADRVLAEAIAAREAASAPLPPAPSLPTPAPQVTTQPAPNGSALVAAPPGGAPVMDPRPAPPAAAGALLPAGVTAAVAAGSEALPATATRRDLAERAWKLHELGNSLDSIRHALESSGGTPEDIEIVMAKLVALEQARRERFRRTVRRALLAGGAIIVVLLAVAIVLGSLSSSGAPAATGTPLPTPGPGTPSQPAPSATPLPYSPIVALLNNLLPGDVSIANGPTPTRAPTNSVLGALFPATASATFSAQQQATADARKNGLPGWVATLVPGGVTVLSVPTPSIDPSGPPTSPCPTSAVQASALFGGPAASWTFNHDQQGWIFILADKPASLRIPANMTVGYLVIGQSLEMRSAIGPITLHNVNFVAISCP